MSAGMEVSFRQFQGLELSAPKLSSRRNVLRKNRRARGKLALMNHQNRTSISRRTFAVTIGAAFMPFAGTRAAENAGRKLDFKIGGGFEAGAADIRAVLNSAADSIWQHCPNTRWEVPGFFIYHNADYPIALNDHGPDGRIRIGLTTKGTYWSQFAYQFAHEFGHALAGHSNDWQKLNIRDERPNHWLEESLCETASLFALRAMGKSWQTKPPYPNWKSYAVHLAKYADDRMQKTSVVKSFADWFRENEPSMRANSTRREKNNVVALQLLPLFEAEPTGWEALTFYNLCKPDPKRTLAAQFAAWRSDTPQTQHAFIGKLASTFGIA